MPSPSTRKRDTSGPRTPAVPHEVSQLAIITRPTQCWLSVSLPGPADPTELLWPRRRLPSSVRAVASVLPTTVRKAKCRRGESPSPCPAHLWRRRGSGRGVGRARRRRGVPGGGGGLLARRRGLRAALWRRLRRRLALPGAAPNAGSARPPRRTQTPLREAQLPGAGDARALEPLRAAPRAGGRPAAGGGRAQARPQQPDGLPRRVAVLLRAPHRGRRAAGPLLPPLGRTASPRPLERHSSLPPTSPPPTHAATTRHRLPRCHPPPAPPPALSPPPPPRQRPPSLAPRSPATLPCPGAPKQWYIVPPAHAARVRRLAADVCASEAAECSHFLRHKQTLLAPSVYRASNVPLRRALQTEGTFVVVQATVSHSLPDRLICLID